MSVSAIAQETTELEELAARAGELNRRQAGSAEVVAGADEFVDDLAKRFGGVGEHYPMDLQDELLFHKALIATQHALHHADRRELRVGLQRVLDALAQIVTNAPVREGRDVRDVAGWVAETFRDVTRQRLAAVIGVNPRTFTRWVEGETRPTDEDARRLRTFARTANLLLRGLTATGVVAWFELPNRELGGATPVKQLGEHDAWVRLERAAYVTLGGDAS